MKRILTFLMTATLLAALPTSLWAQKDHKASSQRRMMTSDGPQSNLGHKFVIDGKVALDVQDTRYNIYITDIDKEITMDDYVESIVVKDRKFRFETDLNTMKIGRLRPVMSNGNVGSAWIDIYFIPGFTIDMTVHNGYYDINNEQQYTFMANAWLNKEALAVLFESMGAPKQTSGVTSDIQELQVALLPYHQLLAQLQDQFKLLKPNQSYYEKEIRAILKRMEEVNAQMQTIIDKYADTIKY